MTKEELAKSIRHGLFAKRSSLKEAMAYVDSLATAAGKDGITVYTAVHVTLNTVADEIEKIEEGSTGGDDL
jgi:cadmium resistance protein CadD (predicted permease)